MVLHFVYALILTVNNYRARGNQRYAVTVNEPGVEWASKNMLVLGVIVVLGLLLHLINFWSKMQLVEIMGGESSIVGGMTVSAHDEGSLRRCLQGCIAWGTAVSAAFVVIYIIWLGALWLHLTHGIWSMFQAVGWANDTWYPRLKCIANVVATILILGFIAVVLVYFLKVCVGGCLQ